MKYIVVLGDGMSDYPIEKLAGKTPLEFACTPNMDKLAPYSEIGLARTVPIGMKPGSDTANLAVMGYNPAAYYTGRSPLEALSMGITLKDTDIAVRCNLVTLSDEEIYEDKKMVDYSAGSIDTASARELIKYIEEKLGTDKMHFYGGVSYRHCLVVNNAKLGSIYTPPHDISGKPIAEYLPQGEYGDLFLELQKSSFDLLTAHPINQARIAQGKRPANSIWLWGEGVRPQLPDFKEKNGVCGAVISAVDLLKGIGKGAGMKVIDIEGATGNLDTNFTGKAQGAIEALKSGCDYVYVHIEAADESGHQGSLEDKIKSIECIDKEVIGTIVNEMGKCGEEYCMLVCPDHPTPISTMTHSADPVPYMIYRSGNKIMSKNKKYNEKTAQQSGILQENGYQLIDKLLEKSPEDTAEEQAVIVTETNSNAEDTINVNDSSATQGAAEDLSAEQSEATAETAETDTAITATTEEVEDVDTKAAKENEEIKAEVIDEIKTEEAEPKPEDTAVTAEENSASDVNEAEVTSIENSTATAEPKPKKPNKFLAFIKSHKLLTAIVAAVLILAIGLTTTYFIFTKDMVFIKSASDLMEAISEGEGDTLVFKKDVTISGDLNVNKGFDWDMNGHTVSVLGDLVIGGGSGSIDIGNKSLGGKYSCGGKIIAESLDFNGTGKLRMYSDVVSPDVSLTAAETSIAGKIGENNGAVSIDSASVTVRGTLLGQATLSAATTLDLYGSAAAISGGNTINVQDGAEVTLIKDTVTVFVYPNGTASTLSNVTNAYFVELLNAPASVYVYEQNEKFYCDVSEVAHADKFIYEINGFEYEAVAVSSGGVTTFELIGMQPGAQKLKVKAVSDSPMYIESGYTSASFEFAVQLAAPEARLIIGADGHVLLDVDSVLYATKYTYSINGTSYTVTSDADVTEDITDKLPTAGVYSIQIIAKSDNNQYFTDSNSTMLSYIKNVQLATPALTLDSITDGLSSNLINVSFSWNAVENVQYYRIEQGGNVYYTTSLSFELKNIVELSEVKITAVGSGYYTDSLSNSIYPGRG